MNSGIYAVVKQYEREENETITTDYRDWHYKTNDYYAIYDKIMELTEGNHESSANAASWCEFASIGETYEDDNWEIEIQEID